jgi:hypothetical protein
MSHTQLGWPWAVVHAATHKYDADDVVAALLDEWHRRTERNIALLKGRGLHSFPFQLNLSRF